MRAADADILMIPGYTNSGPDHWQTRWEQKLSTARRVDLGDWEKPDKAQWIDNLATAVASCTRPTVLVAHSLGVITVVESAGVLPRTVVKGAFLVAPADIETHKIDGVDPAFAPIPRDPLPFPSVLIASRNDPYCSYEKAEDFAYSWGSALVDAGDAGHINTYSGHGPWPEGLMRFAAFLAKLS